MARRSIAAAGWLAIVAACGGSDSGGGPSGPDVVNGVALTAEVYETDASQSGVKLVGVRVVLTNTTDAPITRSYPAGCPVRMRLYRLLDDALMYDETQIPCNLSSLISLTIQPRASATLVTGVRFPWVIAGDSLPPARYDVAAVVRLVADTPLELEAGVYNLPSCNLETGTCVYQQ